MELANERQVEHEFQSMKSVRHVKRHFHNEARDESVMTPQKKFEIGFFNTLFDTALTSIKDSSNCMNTQKPAVSCRRLANCRK
jgi:hypothetical protein